MKVIDLSIPQMTTRLGSEHNYENKRIISSSLYITFCLIKK